MYIEWEDKVLDKLSPELREELTKRRFVRELEGTTKEKWTGKTKRRGAGKKVIYSTVDVRGSVGFSPLVMVLSYHRGEVKMVFSMGGKMHSDTGTFLKVHHIVQEAEKVLLELVEHSKRVITGKA